MAGGLSSIAFPPACPCCATRVLESLQPCAGCCLELDRLWGEAHGLGSARYAEGLPGGNADLETVPRNVLASFRFAGAARDLVHRVKYEGNRPATRYLAGRMAARLVLTRRDLAGGILIPVPLHPVRLRQRGYNQAERLAVVAGRAASIRCRTDVLVRVRATRSQTTLDLEERRASVAEAFGVRACAPRDTPLILVDDVWTTGATAEACCAALRASGHSGEIAVLVAARTPRRSLDMGAEVKTMGHGNDAGRNR
jgi:predicted amidophosphoribosyltransferase